MTKIGFMAVALLLGAPQQSFATNAAAQSPLELANATKMTLTFSGQRVTGCTVTATSNRADVDAYVCNAARACGDKYPRDEDRMTNCLVKSRELLAEKIAANKPIRVPH